MQNKILIIDDDQSNLKVMLNHIRSSNLLCELLSSSNAELGLKIAIEEKPDLVITDWEMPAMSGIELIQKLKANPETQDIAIIMATGVMSAPEYLNTAFDAGAIDFLRKPIDQVELIARIKSTLRLIHSYREIKRQKEELDQLNDLKNKIFSIISHDLREPIVSLQNLLSMIRMGGLTLTEIQKFSALMMHDLNNTQNLLETLLQWAKTQMDGAQISFKVTALSPIIEETLQQYFLTANRKSIVLKSETTPDLFAYTDDYIFRLILRNILSNAIKFTHENGTVTIKAGELDQDTVIISVIDTGVGIPSDQIPLLFSFDNHPSTTGTNHEKGLGIGLLLVKDFVERCKGSISVNSKFGKGSTFSFTLPKS